MLKKLAFIVPLLIFPLLFSFLFIFPSSAHAQTVYNFTASSITYDPTTSNLSFNISNVQNGPIPWSNSSGGMQIVIYSQSEGQYGGETFYGNQQFSDLSPYCTTTHCSVTLYHSGGESTNPLTPNSDVNIIAEGNASNGVPAWTSQRFKFGSMPLTVPEISNLNGGTINVRNTYSENGSFTDPNINATSWAATVDYGDGSGSQQLTLSGTNFILSHTYTTTGTYTETVTITNNLGETGTQFATVTVNPYVIQINGPSSVQTVSEQTYSQNDSFTDPDPEASSWTATVDYGDGSGSQPLTLNSDKTFLLNHVYNTVGGYTVPITITNNFGETGNLNVTIAVAAPFTASNVSFDPSTNILTFTSDANWSSACLHGRCGARTLTVYDSNNNALFQGTWSPGTCLGNGQCQITITNYSPGALNTTQFYLQVTLFKSVVVGGGRTGTFDSQFLPSSIFSSTVTAINTGGDTQGNFVADTDSSGGSTYNSNASVDTTGVDNPAPQAVYQSVRYGNFTYTIPNLTANGTYTVRLHFNELYWGANGNGGGVGSRVFNVSVNGTQELSNFDIYQTAGGANKAVVEQIPATADANGNITIQFQTVTDNAMVNGIELYSGTLPSPTPTPTPTPVTTEAINTGGNISGSFVADADYTGGTQYTSSASVDTTGVTNPAPESVYQSVRYGNFSYTIPTYSPNTSYRVRLHFNELYWGTPLSGNQGGDGSRVFNVAINGTQVLNNFDIYHTAGGANKALVEDFDTNTDSLGRINIQFSTVIDNAMVNGIEVSKN